MSESKSGSIGWIDLTVPDAEIVRDFYAAVTGWQASPVDMGDYSDFAMAPVGDPAQPVAGVCHARGSNAELPPLWIIYINVEDLTQSLAECERLGGSLVAGPKEMGAWGRYAVIRDPAGAVAALFEPAT